MRSPLSARQAEIAVQISRGKSTREIAAALALSPRTVEAHVAAIFNKMGVRSRVELTAALLESSTLHALEANHNNLPRKLTSFIGREAEIAEIIALIESARLVTLVGSGGVGKTSTSLEAAAMLLGRFDGGVWFIELAPLTDGSYIPTAIARALGLTVAATGNPLVHLAKQLGTKRTLLIFDSCEHLLSPAAAAIVTFLRDCRNVKVLASSRQPLYAKDEATYRLPSLTMPSGAIPTMPAAGILDYEATRLFVERASAVDNRFTLSEHNAPAIVAICRRLDGIPLAIELAAARIAMLSPAQIRDQLDERFRILTGGNRGLIARHRTLRALIDWSYDLLSDRERILFRRLGIFPRNFTLTGVVAACDGDPSPGDIAEVLSSLIDKSLVVLETAADEPRH